MRRSKPADSENLDGSDDKPTEVAAVRLLARREHSTVELKRKLQSKGHGQDAVHRVVDKLASRNLVCDERFATSFVSHHGRRGQGPIRIRAELRQQGATNDVIDAALARCELDWVGIAAQVRQRKFGQRPPSNLAERAKQARFLQYRGFSTDQIRAAMASMAGDSVEFPMLDSDSD